MLYGELFSPYDLEDVSFPGILRTREDSYHLITALKDNSVFQINRQDIYAKTTSGSLFAWDNAHLLWLQLTTVAFAQMPYTQRANFMILPFGDFPLIWR